MSPDKSSIPAPEVADFNEPLEEKRIKIIQAFKRPESPVELAKNIYKAFKEGWILKEEFFEEDVLLHFSGAYSIQKIIEGDPDHASYIFDPFQDIKNLDTASKKSLGAMSFRCDKRLKDNQLKFGGHLLLARTIKDSLGNYISVSNATADELLPIMENYIDIADQIVVMDAPGLPYGTRFHKEEFKIKNYEGYFLLEVYPNQTCSAITFSLDER